jgi:hypothetical protein
MISPLDTLNVARLRPMLPEIKQSFGPHADKLERLLSSLWEHLLSRHGLEIAEMLPDAISRIYDGWGNLTIEFASDWFLDELQDLIVAKWIELDVSVWFQDVTLELISPHRHIIGHLNADKINPLVIEKRRKP